MACITAPFAATACVVLVWLLATAMVVVTAPDDAATTAIEWSAGEPEKSGEAAFALADQHAANMNRHHSNPNRAQKAGFCIAVPPVVAEYCRHPRGNWKRSVLKVVKISDS
jgi:hypothetical protein